MTTPVPSSWRSVVLSPSMVSRLVDQARKGGLVRETIELLTSTARSFKEAQAYLIPLLLLSLTPGLVILLFAGCPTLLLYWQQVKGVRSINWVFY